ncbi:MAG: GAF domain-containing protein, partial [Chloroflexi bacterium]|nr:GAF domain-containing protein [Chloroflexota bacterium]
GERDLAADSPALTTPIRFEGSELDDELYERKKPVIIPDIHQDSRWIKAQGDPYIRSWLAVPLLVRGEVIGVLSLNKRQPDFYTEEHLTLVSPFAQYAAIALENARLSEKTHRQAQQLAILNELAGQMTGLIEIKDLCQTMVQSLHQAFGWSSVSIFTVEQAAGELILQAIIGLYSEIARPGEYRQGIGQGIIGEAVATGQILVVNNTHQHPDFFKLEGMNIHSELAFPLKVDKQVIGVLAVASEQFNAFDESDVTALTTIAGQLAIALEKARLFAETRQRAEQLEALRQVSQDLIALRDLDTLLRQIVERAIQLLDGEGGSVFLYRLERQVLELVVALGDKAGPVGVALSPGEGVSGHVWADREPLIINDYQGWSGKFPLWSHFSNLSVIGVPIQWGSEALGVLNILADNTQRCFTPEDATLLAQFATQAAIAIQNARLYQAERARYHEAEAMRQAALALTSTIAMDQVLERILAELQRVVPYDSASVQLLKGDHLEIIGGHGFPNLPELLGISFPINSSDNPNALVLKSREPIIIHDVSIGYPAFNQGPHAAANIHAWMGVPLFIGDQTIGMLALDKRIPDFYTETHARTAMSYAAQAAIAIENAQLYEQAQRHATELEKRVAERTFELQVLYELTQALGQATQLGDVIRLTLMHLYQVIPHDISASLIITDMNGTLVIQSQRALSSQVEANIQAIMCAVLNQPLTKTLDVHRIQSRSEKVTRPLLEDLASMMQVPIIVDKNPIGLLLVASEEPNQFNQEQVRFLRTVADQAADFIGRQQRLLAAEHQQLESLVANLPDGIVLLDEDRRIVLANPAAQKFLTTLTQTITGEKLSYLGDRSIEMILEHHSTGLSQDIESPGYPRRVFEIAAKPMAVGPEAGGWALVIRDVTEERTNQERTQQQNRLVAVGQLAAGIAHDFNNILTSMIGFAELARIHPHIPPEVSNDLQRIIHQGQRAARLIRQILDFSRQSITEKRPIDVAPFLKETIKLLERTIPEDIRITLEIEPGSPEAYTLNADPTQLQQVLTNLAVNARDAMPAGGTLQFRLSNLTLNPGERPPYPEMSPGHWIALSVSDNGTGISASVLPHIFEPFFTTKGVGKGTGLGLAQVYGIITQHEGYIDVETQIEQGTTFTLYLPCAFPLQKSLAPSSETETIRGHGEVILVVEDDLAVLEVTQAMLEHLGYRVLTATNGRQALEVYNQYQDEIALVLTDVTMPEMGGVALSQTLQAKYPAIKVVALTGYPLEGEAKDLLAQGIVDWQQKPLNRRQLGQTISRLLKPEAHSAARSEG